MHLLVELHGQHGWVAAPTPPSVDGLSSRRRRRCWRRRTARAEPWAPGVRAGMPKTRHSPASIPPSPSPKLREWWADPVAGRDLQQLASQSALTQRSGDGSFPSGRDIGRHHGRHERWGHLVKRACHGRVRHRTNSCVVGSRSHWLRRLTAASTDSEGSGRSLSQRNWRAEADGISTWWRRHKR